MSIFDGYEQLCTEPDSVIEKMNRVCIIEDANEEYKLYGSLLPETEEALNGIGIDTQDFIRRIQETT